MTEGRSQKTPSPSVFPSVRHSVQKVGAAGLEPATSCSRSIGEQASDTTNCSTYVVFGCLLSYLKRRNRAECSMFYPTYYPTFQASIYSL